MNKYFKIIKDLGKEMNINKYELINKLDIALEFESLKNNIELTDEQEERLIELIYDLYMDCDNVNLSPYHYTLATIKTIEDYENYEQFWQAYIDNAEDVEIEIRENIEY